MIETLLMALALQAVPAPEPAPMATVRAMLAALGNRDREAMAATFLPTASATHIAGGKVRQFPITEFLANVKPGPEKYAEPIYNPQLRVDGDLATVWAAYEFRIDGKIHHCGTDAFDLVRLDGQWKIASVAWTQSKDCAAR